MSQPTITAFAKELLDRIFAYLVDKGDWLALCKTHRSFKASGQRLLFRDIQIPAQHSAHSTRRCSMLVGGLTAASHPIIRGRRDRPDPAPVLPASLGARAGLQGAALVAWERRG